VWKFNTPEPERGGVSVTASGLGFAGGGDGVLRAFDLKTGKVLSTFQTGRQIAAGPTIFTAGGKEYIAVTVGGTPTSSGGGLASQLQVFALGGSQTESPKPPNLPLVAQRTDGAPAAAPAASGSEPATRTSRSQVAAIRGARLSIAGGAAPMTLWNPDSSNLREVTGRVTFRGKPVQGVRIAVDRYVLPRVTDAEGRFAYSVDTTLPRRHPVTVVGASRATIGGRPLTDAQQAALRKASAGINVAYNLVDVRAVKRANGTVRVTGRAIRSDGAPVPRVVLLSYRLDGTITDAAGEPVRGAYVVTRTNDRDFWAFSEPSNANGYYASFFPASDLSEADPVEFTVQVAVGRTNYTTGARNPTFKRRSSATLDLTLPRTGAVISPLPTSSAKVGAMYRGLLVGVSTESGVVQPVSARWPDANGRFELVLPASVSGKVLRFWELDFQAYQRITASPGGRVDLKAWPKGLSRRVARDIGFVRAPG
jgi:hypothetical protein